MDLAKVKKAPCHNLVFNQECCTSLVYSGAVSEEGMGFATDAFRILIRGGRELWVTSRGEVMLQ